MYYFELVGFFLEQINLCQVMQRVNVSFAYKIMNI